MNELGNTPADKNYKPSGISKAEERALEAYPNVLFPFTPLDLNAYRREAFINGYEAAEKDLKEAIVKHFKYKQEHSPEHTLHWWVYKNVIDKVNEL